ncbi:MAG: bifunctional methylenetetrahydrofolate dehydrogenase/methenyltetrahydrofolate cyclohydrolase FolD [candidate division NC10 bacterium]|nr:bifunctional methylenetetrahydrofolate dehydrogenase/methenyltetrahydrofolate cyclohydrolase FolD [candidate division NC10 bacterium]MBI2454538.1 bifunctional methylenetetrahydrofolate dehydrogenase/methenyltetrahydrofolate cyclohydrolase FolD [candidate division NC10 bacterium]
MGSDPFGFCAPAQKPSARIIDGKKIAAGIREEIRQQVLRLQEATRRVPGLAAVLVGDDPASATYVRTKTKACHEVGIASRQLTPPGDITQADLRALIQELNGDPDIHGVLVQLPLPRHLDERAILETVDPQKDVDGFTFANVGRLVENQPQFVPCTPAGILELLDREGVEINGKHAVVVGRSEIVGKPVAFLLLHRHATVTICHSRTADLAAETRRADILVAAVGRPRLITGAMLKPGAVVIDVGINRVDGKLVGDVDFDSAAPVASAITPVPGGVGPMTVAMLLRNTLQAFERSLARDVA